MSTKHLLVGEAVALVPRVGLARRLAAALLSGASALLARLAARLHVAERPPAPDPQLEFHAEAGAPEGALYVDGQLVGRLFGVTRL